MVNFGRLVWLKTYLLAYQSNPWGEGLLLTGNHSGLAKGLFLRHTGTSAAAIVYLTHVSLANLINS
jgi:hypothetical protein